MEPLDEDTLYVAATRPALFAGVPLVVAGGLLMAAGFVIVILKNPFYEAVMGPLWFGARMVVARDYNAVGVVMLFLRTAGRSLDSDQWGGASVTPCPIRISGTRGML